MNDMTPPAAVGAPFERGVRALHPERAAFEAWFASVQDPAADLIWEAWKAARPKRAAVGRLVNVAAVLTSPTPMRKLWHLEEEAGRTLGRRALSDALADSYARLKTLAIELAALARAL